MSKMSPDEWTDEQFAEALAAVTAWSSSGHPSLLVSEFPEDAPSVVRFESPVALIELADAAAPRLVYAKIEQFGDENLELLAERVSDGILGSEDEGEDTEDEAVELSAEVEKIEECLRELGHQRNDPVAISLGFAVDGVFHFSVGVPRWYERLLETVMPQGITSVIEDGSSQEAVRLMKHALELGLVEKVLADHRALGAISNADLSDAFWAVATELVPDLEPMIQGDRRSMRYALYTHAPDLSRRIALRRVEIENDALGRIEELAREFLAEPGVANATTLKVKEPLAARFVERRLGFRSSAVANQVARWKEQSAQGSFRS